jgi:hypothetical protein
MPTPGVNELPRGYRVLFIGYPDERIEEMTSIEERMQHEAIKKYVDRGRVPHEVSMTTEAIRLREKRKKKKEYKCVKF